METNSILLFIIVVLLLLLFTKTNNYGFLNNINQQDLPLNNQNLMNNNQNLMNNNQNLINNNQNLMNNNQNQTTNNYNNNQNNDIDTKRDLENLKQHVMENKIRTELLQDNRDADILRYNRVHDPLTAPERSYPFMMNRNKVPINIETRGQSMEYQQIGFIHSTSEEEKLIYPLYGRQIWRGSSKWTYYTGTDKIHQIKLPIVHNNRQCMSEYGCDQLYDGDEIDVPPYKYKFKVQIYNLDAPKYIPL